MSENIPESIPTSQDRRSHRPLKRARATTPTSLQASKLDALFLNPDRPIELPSSSTTNSTLAPPEIVANVQGSSAGAGSGEFHVYKASRRREYERLRVMDEEKEREDAAEKFEREKASRERADEEKTRRKREKRQKRGKGGAKKDGGGDGKEGDGGKGKFKPNSSASGGVAALGRQGGDGEGGVVVQEEVGIVIHDDD